MREALAVTSGPVNLAGYDPEDRPLASVKRNSDLRNDDTALCEMQKKLWAEGTAGSERRVLLVLQGIDTAGKGGVTKHVVGVFDPIGVQYTGFKAPTKAELRHDFLW
jgi:polyphosphate kinase 2 (PPK2 family)